MTARPDIAPRYAPKGHDAPKHTAAWANFKAAEISSDAVYGRAVHCPVHRASLEAWQRGERASPWPTLTDTELLALSKGHRTFVRTERGVAA